MNIGDETLQVFSLPCIFQTTAALGSHETKRNNEMNFTSLHSVVFQGLDPIPSRILYDGLAILGLLYASLTPIYSNWNAILLVGSCVLTVATAGGFTNRWTLTLPMVPILISQGLRRLIPNDYASTKQSSSSSSSSHSSSRWINRLHGLVTFLSVLLIVLAAALCVLFPAVQLPPVRNALYTVGVVDFYLPVRLAAPSTSTSSCPASFPDRNDTIQQYQQQQQQSQQTVSLPVRLWYPTTVTASWNDRNTIAYLHPSTAQEFCQQTIRFGAPPPLKQFGWMLHTWRLARVPAHRNAPLLVPDEVVAAAAASLPPLSPVNTKLPLIVFSHGLGGSAELYSYQTMSLAAQGNVVLSLNHLDGSAPVVQLVNGTKSTFDFELGKLWLQGHHVEYVRARRERTKQRANELTAAVEAMRQLSNPEEEEEEERNHGYGDGGGGTEERVQLENEVRRQLPFDLRGRLDTETVTFMGHSFGGATVLQAAKQRPDLVQSVVAHDPALDWLPDEARRSLFAPELLKGLEHHNFTGGTGGFTNDDKTSSSCSAVDQSESSSLHDTNILFLFSEEWIRKGWAFTPLLEDMYSSSQSQLNIRNKKLADGVVSSFQIVPGAHHNEFSDTCMLTPIWLARATGIAGPRNPSDVAWDIADATRDFLYKSRRVVGASSSQSTTRKFHQAPDQASEMS